MKPERWALIEQVFHAARERDPADRAAYLAEACRNDSELRQYVESLLLYQEDLVPTAAALAQFTHIFSTEGAEIGPYRVETKLGEGGMGVVFRALDTRLGRKVAIKISPLQFNQRFQREAQAIAALNHPHVCTLYDVGPNYLVMELLEGETLAARLRRGPLPIRDVARYGAQIADALAEAHAQGIVHRDLKPTNVMLTRSGVKVLDFGIARRQSGDSLTAAGGIVGTPAYMAPEQLVGQTTDARTDIFGLGLVLYEMATGQHPQAASADSLERLPESIRPVVERCLALDPGDRWQSASDIKAVLEWTGTRSMPAKPKPASGRVWPGVLIAAGLLLAMVLAWMVLREPVSDSATTSLHLSISPPPNTSFRFARNGEGGFALSPDGEMIAFVGRTDGKAQLWLRRLSSGSSVLLPGTEGAYMPFWSPDSKWIGFCTPQGQMKKIAVTGGAPVHLRDVLRIVSGASWNNQDVLIFLGAPYKLLRGSAAGGPSEELSYIPNAMWPHFLPDDQRFIYAAASGGKRPFNETPDLDLWVASLNPEEKPRLLRKGQKAVYSAGHLLFHDRGTIFAQPFDPALAEFSGDAVPVNAMLASRLLLGNVMLDFSANAQGMFIFPPHENAFSSLTWRDRAGKPLGTLGAPGEYYNPRISHDDRRVVFSRRDNKNSDIWVADASGSESTRLTFDSAIDEHPIWSAFDDAVLFANDGSGRANLFQKAATGAGQPRQLTSGTLEKQAHDWSTDGRFVVFTQIRGSSEIMVMSLAGGEPVSFLQNGLGAVHPQFNPGPPRWIAYDHDDTGRREVYVQAFTPGQPASAARWQISTEGGVMPRWRADGKELFYLTLDGKMMAVTVSSDRDAFRAAAPVFLFDATPPSQRTPSWEYDVSSDGKRFLMIEPAIKPESQILTFVTDWRTLIAN